MFRFGTLRERLCGDGVMAVSQFVNHALRGIIRVGGLSRRGAGEVRICGSASHLLAHQRLKVGVKEPAVKMGRGDRSRVIRGGCQTLDGAASRRTPSVRHVSTTRYKGLETSDWDVRVCPNLVQGEGLSQVTHIVSRCSRHDLDRRVCEACTQSRSVPLSLAALHAGWRYL